MRHFESRDFLRGVSAMEPLSAIGARIRTFRKRRGLTQGELAARIGRSTEALSVLERGRATPTLPVLSRLSEALAVPLCDFFAPAGMAAQDPEEAALVAALLDSARALPPADLTLATRILALIAEQRAKDSQPPNPPLNPPPNPLADPPPEPLPDPLTADPLGAILAALRHLYRDDRQAITATLTRRRRFLTEMGNSADAAFLDALLKRLWER